MASTRPRRRARAMYRRLAIRVLLRVQGYGPLMYTTTGEQLKRTGNKEATYAGIDVFECKDGNYCVVQVSGRPAAKAIGRVARP